MFDDLNNKMIAELKEENELFFNLSLIVLNHGNYPITPFAIKETMLDIELICQDEDMKEIIESDDREHKAYILLQTGDVTLEKLQVLFNVCLLSKDKIDRVYSGETKIYSKKLSLEAPVISIKEKEIEEKVCLCVKRGIYSKIEVQKMIDNGLIDRIKLDKYYQLYGLNRSSKLTEVFRPIMSFDGVRLSNDLVIGGVDDNMDPVDELAKQQIYIF